MRTLRSYTVALVGPRTPQHDAAEGRPWIRNPIIILLIKCDWMTTVRVYVRTVDYTLGPMEFTDDDVLGYPVISFLFACRQAFQCGGEQWYAPDQGKPAVMCEIFGSSGMDLLPTGISTVPTAAARALRSMVLR
jgi:hypothetical protein